MNNNSFFDLGLDINICNRLKDLGFNNPFYIQLKSIPKIIKGLNIIGIAKTGSGKTISFITPFLNSVNIDIKKTQFLIIEPTRELVIQVTKVLLDISHGIKNINVSSLYGGQNYNIEFNSLKNKSHFVIGTVGRIIDHINKKTLNISEIKGLVIDEADEMSNTNFIKDIKYILSNINKNYQIILFSATYSNKIKNITSDFKKNNIEIINDKNYNTPNINQKYIIINNFNKHEILLRLIETLKFKLCIIFVNTKDLSLKISNLLKEFNYNSLYINGDLNQKLREETINLFKLEKINILIATDIVSRGIDINNIDLIINYDIPKNIDIYTHRIGRTGRANKYGESIILINNNEYFLLKNIKNKYKKIYEIFVPKLSEIEYIRQKNLINNLKSFYNNKDILDYKKIIFDILKEFDNDYISVINILLNIFNKNKPLIIKNNLYNNNNNISKVLLNKNNYFILKINVGTLDKINKKFIIKILLCNYNIKFNDIGNIYIYKNFSKIKLYNLIFNSISYNKFLNKNIEFKIIK